MTAPTPAALEKAREIVSEHFLEGYGIEGSLVLEESIAAAIDEAVQAERDWVRDTVNGFMERGEGVNTWNRSLITVLESVKAREEAFICARAGEKP